MTRRVADSAGIAALTSPITAATATLSLCDCWHQMQTELRPEQRGPGNTKDAVGNCRSQRPCHQPHQQAFGNQEADQRALA